jgi:hypothetical protein
MTIPNFASDQERRDEKIELHKQKIVRIKKHTPVWSLRHSPKS